MRNAVLLLLLFCLLGLSGAVWGEESASYPTSAYQGFRVHGGWGWPADEGQQAVWGADYIWKHALVTANYAQSDRQPLEFSPPITGANYSVRDKFWSVEASYLWRPAGDPTVYAGGGWGWVRLERDEAVTIVVPDAPTTHRKRRSNAGIGNLVVGKEFPRENEFGRSAFFVEARYNFLAEPRDEEWDLKVDLKGPRLVLGWRF